MPALIFLVSLAVLWISARIEAQFHNRYCKLNPDERADLLPAGDGAKVGSPLTEYLEQFYSATSHF